MLPLGPWSLAFCSQAQHRTDAGRAGLAPAVSWASRHLIGGWIAGIMQAELEGWRQALQDSVPWLVCRVGSGQLEAHCRLCSTHKAPSVSPPLGFRF